MGERSPPLSLFLPLKNCQLCLEKQRGRPGESEGGETGGRRRRKRRSEDGIKFNLHAFTEAEPPEPSAELSVSEGDVAGSK